MELGNNISLGLAISYADLATSSVGRENSAYTLGLFYIGTWNDGRLDFLLQNDCLILINTITIFIVCFAANCFRYFFQFQFIIDRRNISQTI